MAPIHDRPPSKKPPVALANYDTLLARAVENLPNSSPTARAAFYERTRMALVAQLKAENRPVSIEAEVRVLEQAIARLEARIMENAPDDTATPESSRSGGWFHSLLPRTPRDDDSRDVSSGPAKSDGWLSDLLTRASSDDASKVKSISERSRETRQGPPRVAVVRPHPNLSSRSPPSSKSEGVIPKEIRQEARHPPPVETPPIDTRSDVYETAPAITSSTGAQEKPMSRSDELNRALRKLQNDSPGVEASALISEDGLMIASVLSPDLEESRVAGMTATLLNLGSRAAIELGRGNVREVIVRGENGYAVLINAGRGALLLALTDESAKLGLIFFDMREAVRTIAKIL